MGIFLSYVFLGLSLSAPMGPINAAQLEKGIRSGFFHAWILGIGALLADVIYMALIYLGVIHFLEKDIIKLFLWSFGAFVLIYTGIESVKNANQISISNTRNDDSIIKSFFSGFFMSLSNPLTILFWLGIFGSILAKAASSYNKEQLLLYSFGIILGIFIWDITMASTSSIFRKILNTRILSLITVISGISLIIYGLYFGFQTYQIIFQ
ncbi:MULTISPECIES: LysE family transporter [Bacillus cereus group]|uniref:LysE family transporter n=1 Tax=Bacillus cereus group TaxID=86661 RepID=UPI000943C30F|nr:MULTISPECIES: LysE family transporter [Bacillus cereus group]MCU5173421.1 LysE family translocator [Bacillus paranthracis]MDA1917436.1 LysE family transporter [Bacillus cereus group sp. BcHK140]MDA2237931.1 LysE family transporter [Bacillus cereus group sp. Bc222]MDA2586127.1 LysE family transporter [Bacillus cereus group sp. Bc062]HDR7773988.1 LysE family transporter [Bacillus paranthracis]